MLKIAFKITEFIKYGWNKKQLLLQNLTMVYAAL